MTQSVGEDQAPVVPLLEVHEPEVPGLELLDRLDVEELLHGRRRRSRCLHAVEGGVDRVAPLFGSSRSDTNRA